MQESTNNTSLLGPPITIESPEQFVPLFLVKYKPYDDIGDCRSLFYNEIDVDFDKHEDPMTREDLKEQLVKRLNFSYPKKYALELNSMDSMQVSAESSNVVLNTFQGLRGSAQFAGSLTHCGLYCTTQFKYNSKLNLLTYPLSAVHQNRTQSTDPFQTLIPLILVTVQAKYIPQLRARLYLGLNTNIPLGSFKVMYNNMAPEWGNMRPRQLVQHLEVNLIKPQEAHVEYSNTADMLKLLVEPKVEMTLENKWKKATRMLEALEKNVDIFEPINR